MKRAYTIEYGCGCTIGKIRKNNEDNYYCCGQFRLNPDSVEDEFLSGKVKSTDNELFAVFDGMGGEACGEVASFIAAQNSSVFCENKAEYEEYLYELGDLINERIKEETQARCLVLMGTTGAMIQFYKDEIYILNVGDSRIYKFAKGELNQISLDHVAAGYSGKAPLTKFLGMPEGAKYSPYIARGAYKTGDLFILCTDGVYDMVKDEGLKNLVNVKKPLDLIAKDIIEKAKECGGVDNATVILCKISR
ncbi:MAG: serine/threonine-protein phosphatase [Ruminococcus sp.]|nr:serine/threonine-protein phosphatase [Ruminococcus sp.]